MVLVGHGSKAPGFDAAMRKVASALRRSRRYRKVLCAFLEVSDPPIMDAIARCVQAGATEVRVLPYFVLTGKHVTRDIPFIVRAAARKFRRQARVILCSYLGYHAKIVSVVQERLRLGVSS